MAKRASETSNLARVSEHAREPSVARSLARGVGDAARGAGRLARGEVVKRVGGPARARVVVVFGAVLALNGADTATIGAISPQLETALHIGNTKIGLLSTVALLVGALFTLPVGLLVDHQHRAVEHRHHRQRLRRQLLGAAVNAAPARCGHGHGRPGDRIPDR